jgi:N-acetylmuramoyl-L-alanine amidase
MKALGSVKKLVVHHSASNPATTTVELIRRWHVTDNGWDDIGYHWIITADGRVHTGRSPVMQGAHAPLANSSSWAVCVVGDNTRREWGWNHVQESSLLDLIEAVQFLIPGVEILGHRDTGEATLCPGIDIREWLKGIM